MYDGLYGGTWWMLIHWDRTWSRVCLKHHCSYCNTKILYFVYERYVKTDTLDIAFKSSLLLSAYEARTLYPWCCICVWNISDTEVIVPCLLLVFVVWYSPFRIFLMVCICHVAYFACPCLCFLEISIRVLAKTNLLGQKQLKCVLINVWVCIWHLWLY